jgi:hypothetical protein
MEKIAKTQNEAPSAPARARTDSEKQASLSDQFACKYFFCQIKIERATASDVKYVFHLSHRFLYLFWVTL